MTRWVRFDEPLVSHVEQTTDKVQIVIENPILFLETVKTDSMEQCQDKASHGKQMEKLTCHVTDLEFRLERLVLNRK